MFLDQRGAGDAAARTPGGRGGDAALGRASDQLRDLEVHGTDLEVHGTSEPIVTVL